MRDFKGMKRQRGRNRNGGSGGGGGGKPQHNTNRAFDSNGPEGIKVRGAAQGVYEKYQQLARDAQTSGDRVLAENYLQHAEHYFRLMRAMQPQRPLSEIIGRDQFVSGYDIDFEDESANTEAMDADGENSDSGEGEPRQDRFDNRREDYRQGQPQQRPREERPREERFQSDRPREDRQRDDRQRDDRQREDRQRDDRQFENRTPENRSRNDRSRDDRPREDRPRDDNARNNNREDRPRYNREDRPARFERQERDPMVVVEPESTPLAPEPAVSPGPMLRADDGDVSHAPAFLQVRPAESRDDAPPAEPRPRRRRAPRAVAAADGSPPPLPAEEG